MDSDFSTNPAPEAEAPAEAEAPEVESSEPDDEAPETEASEDGDQPSEDELEEAEYEGKKYKLPKELKAALMRQADYTKKTQEAAELRRQAEMEREIVQADRAFYEAEKQDVAHLTMLASQIKAYEEVDWDAFQANDPQAAQNEWFKFQRMKSQAQDLDQAINGKRQSYEAAKQQAMAQARRQASEALSKPDPAYGWSGKFTPELKQKLNEVAYGLGYTDKQLVHAEARDVKLFNLAMIGLQALKAQRKPSQPVANPVPTVKPGAIKAVTNPDKLNDKDWLVWREKQLAKKGRL